MRPLGLQYIVSGQLDGITPAPSFGVPPTRGPYDPDSQMLTFEVEDLGLVDLTGLAGGSGQLADRIVKWIIILGPSVPFNDRNIGVAFDDGIGQNDVEIGAAALGVYSRQCIRVPQTASLRLDGMAASPTEPVVVRMGVWMPQTKLELAAMIQSCCCTGAAITSLGLPAFRVDLPLA
jgi:hypothetical protein